MALLRERTDREHEQVLIRIVISFVILIYLVLRYLDSSTPSPAAGRLILISALYSFAACVLLIHRLWSSTVQPHRRFAGMLLDLAFLLGGMATGDDVTAFLYPFFLWVTLGMGLRYGTRYMFMAAFLSVVSFAIVIVITPYWRDQLVLSLSLSLLLALIVLPAYVWLLTKPTEHAEKTKHEEDYSTIILPKHGRWGANFWHKLQAIYTLLLHQAHVTIYRLVDPETGKVYRVKAYGLPESGGKVVKLEEELYEESMRNRGALADSRR